MVGYGMRGWIVPGAQTQPSNDNSLIDQLFEEMCSGYQIIMWKMV